MESHTVAEEEESIPRCSVRMLSAAFPSVLYRGAWRDPKTDRAINVRLESIDKLAQFAEAVTMTKFFERKKKQHRPANISVDCGQWIMYWPRNIEYSTGSSGSRVLIGCPHMYLPGFHVRFWTYCNVFLGPWVKDW